jgi:hypothetical protein
MADNFVRIQSVESGTFTSSQNRATFIIPGNSGVVSLRDSFMELVANVEYGGAIPNPHPCFLKWKVDATTYDNYFPNIAMIRNADIRTSMQGQVDSLRRVDVLRSNTMFYRKGCFALESDDYLSASSIRHPAEQNQYGVFFQGNKVGPIASRMREAPLPIALPDMLDFCEIDAIDTSKTGDITIHVEMNLGGSGRSGPLGIQQIDTFGGPEFEGAADDIPVAPAGGSTFVSITDDGVFTSIGASPFRLGQKYIFTAATVVGGAPVLVGQEFSVGSLALNGAGNVVITFAAARADLTNGQGYTGITYGPVGGINAIANIPAAPAGGAAFTSITTAPFFQDLDSSPYYVGQRLEFLAATVVGGAPDIVGDEITIGEISQNANGSLLLTFKTAKTALTAGQGYTGVRVGGLNSTEATLTFPECRLVYKTMAPMSQMPMMYEYSRYETIEENGSGLVNYQRGIELDGSASEVLLVPIDPDTHLLATDSEWEQFRLRVNNIEMTDRPVLVGSPLYFDRLVTTLLEMGIDVRSVQQNNPNPSGIWPTAWQDSDQDLVLAGTPMPQVVGPKKNLQIIIECAAGGEGVRSYAVFARRTVILDLRK